MNKKFVSLSPILKQAKEALQRGEKHKARYWAQIAASIAPKGGALANPGSGCQSTSQYRLPRTGTRDQPEEASAPKKR